MDKGGGMSKVLALQELKSFRRSHKRGLKVRFGERQISIFTTVLRKETENEVKERKLYLHVYFTL